jgi:Transglycosylase SLT domain
MNRLIHLVIAALCLVPPYLNASYLQGTVKAWNGAKVEIAASERTYTVLLSRLEPTKGCAAKGAVDWGRGYTGARVVFDPVGLRVYLDIESGVVDAQELALRAGHARLREHVKDEDHDRLEAAQQEAKDAQRGLWAPCPTLSDDVDVYIMVGREKGIDDAILRAIAITESGRNGKPHPWTLNVHGKGMFFDTREAAYAHLLGYLRAGYTSIDVGSMQVNLRHHGFRFVDLWSALDPVTNTRVAADILRENYTQSGTVPKAVASYHSRNPERGYPYFNRFLGHYVRTTTLSRNGRIRVTSKGDIQ